MAANNIPIDLLSLENSWWESEGLLLSRIRTRAFFFLFDFKS